MPALPRPSKRETVRLPARDAVIAADTDVLVVGGGPAGLGAAVGAAREGASVILAERYGFLGGNATAALVMPFCSYHTEHHTAVRPEEAGLFPADHGPGDPVIGGVLTEFVDRLAELGGAIQPSVRTGYTVPFDPETFKQAALDMLDDAGVRFLFHSLASTTIGEGAVHGVVFETKSGPIAIRARATVDCTGDADIAHHSGAPYEVGRDKDGLVQPMTLLFRMIEFERGAFSAYVKANPDQWDGVMGLWDLVHQATRHGELQLPRENILFFGTPHEREVAVNSTRIGGVVGIDVWDLTYAEWRSRQQMRQVVAFLQKHVPGFEQSYAAQSGVQIGVRETRRIVGEYTLTADDIVTARKFHDVIARATYPIDIHNPEGPGTILRRVPQGDAYDIPLRCLIPQIIDNLTIGGRCLSGTHEAKSSARVMPICMATGQAAGVCAAIAARTGRQPRNVPAREVQMALKKQGANLRDVV